VRIFLSYGHDEYVSLASRVKRDPEVLGHEVWFDVERLKPGGDWERYIEEGFERVSKDSESRRFLLLMTPHSVRRPDGYCLNELARAYGRSLPIIPVMVSTVDAPLSICRLQWLDMRQCFPVEQHEERDHAFSNLRFVDWTRQELIEEAKARSRMSTFQHSELLPEHEILQNKIPAVTEEKKTG
jgi:hypothetical protein